MVAVAIAGLACGGEALRQRRARFLERANRLKDEVWQADGHYCGSIVFAAGTPESVKTRGRQMFASYMHRKLRYLEALQGKYERAARYPWLPVPPDPPEPE